MRFPKPRPLLLLGLLLVTWGIISACAPAKAKGQVHVLTWKGDVNPVMARYLDRGISTAERSKAAAVVIRLDTPGGLDSSMREIIQRIEAAKVAVIVYVSPAGGRAASAGTFITMAGHVAAMAPNTSIGAATPINSGGDDIPGALGRKVTNDAVSYIRGIAELRGRNADWAEKAVRDAASVNQNEAVSLKVVDFVATDMQDLLARSDGRASQVTGDDGALKTITIKTAGLSTYENNRNIFKTILDLIATPDIAFLLLSLGGLALLTEIFHASLVAGIFGIISLCLAYFSLGALPTNWAGVALILFAFILFGAEIFASGFGALGIGGIISLILGGLILTGSRETPGLEVNRWLIIGVSVPIGAFFMFVLAALVRIRRTPAGAGIVRLVGRTGVARTLLNPGGYVAVLGERWEATAEDPPIEYDAQIIVTAVEGSRLKVKREGAPLLLLPAAPEKTETPAEAVPHPRNW